VLWDSNNSGNKAELNMNYSVRWVLKGSYNSLAPVRMVQGGGAGRAERWMVMRADIARSNDVGLSWGNGACGSARDYCFISLWISVPGPETAE